ncbi:hypothetical protein C8Q79DRAFT_752655 [Trametes meyenii]|nr:hypothetical protein C8Q79DRAFT_752655 [Trametes meyenii]
MERFVVHISTHISIAQAGDEILDVACLAPRAWPHLKEFWLFASPTGPIFPGVFVTFACHCPKLRMLGLRGVSFGQQTIDPSSGKLLYGRIHCVNSRSAIVNLWSLLKSSTRPFLCSSCTASSPTPHHHPGPRRYNVLPLLRSWNLGCTLGVRCALWLYAAGRHGRTHRGLAYPSVRSNEVAYFDVLHN